MSPHEANYSLKVVGSSTGAGVTGGEGTLVSRVELTCTDITASQRFFARIEAVGEKPAIGEFEARFQETLDSGSFNFTKTTAFDLGVSRRIAGEARRDPAIDRVRATYDEPQGLVATGPFETVFPQAFRARVLNAAKDGRTEVREVVFDGTPGGAFLRAHAVIGGPIARGTGPRFSDAPSVRNLRAWPVTIVYRPIEGASGRAEGDPYQVSYTLYENGVLGGLNIGFGAFRFDVTLVSVTYFDPPRDCGG